MEHKPNYAYALEMIDSSKKGIAERLKVIIQETGATRQQMADIAKCTPQSIQSWLTTGRASHNRLQRITTHYKYNLAWLLTGEGSKYQSDVVQPEPKGITLEDKEILEGLKLLSPQQKKAVKLLIESIVEAKPEKPDFKEKEMREAATRAVDSRALKGRRKLSPEAREELIEQTLQEMLHSEGQLENQDYHNQTLKQKSR